jgi:hypothetical protein
VGEPRLRGCGVAHLTLPIAAATGPLPLPPQAGGEGGIARRLRCQRRWVNLGQRRSGGRDNVRDGTDRWTGILVLLLLTQSI